MKNFLDVDTQIELNQKVLDLYYENYQKTQSKLTNLVLIYSVIAVYLMPIFQFGIKLVFSTKNLIIYSQILLLILFLLLLVISIRKTYELLKPIEIAYMHEPNFYYNDVKLQYEGLLNTQNEDVLNGYIKATYLNELEMAVIHNSEIFKQKSQCYDQAFRFSILSLLIYILCFTLINLN